MFKGMRVSIKLVTVYVLQLLIYYLQKLQFHLQPKNKILLKVGYLNVVWTGLGFYTEHALKPYDM